MRQVPSNSTIDHEVPDDPSGISKILLDLKQSFLSHTTKDVKFRK
jgi:hypothetical protein